LQKLKLLEEDQGMTFINTSENIKTYKVKAPKLRH